MQLRPGNIVRLRSYGNEEIERRVVAVTDKTVVVCRFDEWDTAERDGRQPTSVGFPKSAILQPHA